MHKVVKTTLAAAAAGLLAACGDVSVTGPGPIPASPFALNLPASQSSGESVTESREVHGFSAVSISGVGVLYIEQTGVESLTVSAEASALPKLMSEVRGGRLVLGTTPGSDLSTSVPIEYRLSVRDLSEISVAGVVRVEARDLAAARLRIHVQGLSQVDATGTVDWQEIVASGSGRYRAGELASRQAHVVVSESASAVLRVSDRLDARVSGAGVVEYYGDPTVISDVSGAGRLVRVGS